MDARSQASAQDKDEEKDDTVLLALKLSSSLSNLSSFYIISKESWELFSGNLKRAGFLEYKQLLQAIRKQVY